MLFVGQLMLGKMILPIFGGVPAVWNTCMVFFQAALLAGYAYSHASVTWLGARRQAILHVALLLVPLFVLPISISPEWTPPAGADPIAPLLGLLAVSIGLPFFVAASTAPLLQKWFAEDTQASRDPYVLYAASNAGSMLGLLAYPVLIEPYVPLRVQSLLWTAGYGLLVLLNVSCAVMLWRSDE
jgi:dipeptide/tripeptide permease